jgi:hypothetical protein
MHFLTIVSTVLFLTVWVPFVSFTAIVQDLGNVVSEFFVMRRAASPTPQ